MLTFIVSRTYETVTPESAEQGDADERGYVYEDETMEFRDVIRELREMNWLSDSHPTARTWAAQESYITDYETGESRSESLHISHVNRKPITEHQIKRLFRAAGLMKGN